MPYEYLCSHPILIYLLIAATLFFFGALFFRQSSKYKEETKQAEAKAKEAEYNIELERLKEEEAYRVRVAEEKAREEKIQELEASERIKHLDIMKSKADAEQARQKREAELDLTLAKGRLREAQALVLRWNLQALAILNGYEFEKFIGDFLRLNGFASVVVTQKSNDNGVDILAADASGAKYAVQCKKYSGAVGISAIQEIYTAKSIYDCDVAMVATNSSFTKSAIEIAGKLGVKLLDGETIGARMAEHLEYVIEMLNKKREAPCEVALSEKSCIVEVEEDEEKQASEACQEMSDDVSIVSEQEEAEFEKFYKEINENLSDVEKNINEAKALMQK